MCGDGECCLMATVGTTLNQQFVTVIASKTRKGEYTMSNG
jgi:hypothetical protein